MATTSINISATFNSNSAQGKKCKYIGQSVRAVPIRIVSVGKKRSQGLQLIVDDYVEKLKFYCAVEDVQIRSNPRNARDQRAQVDDEDCVMMNLIRSDDWVVMLDEHGQDIGSEQMAELVGDAGNTVMNVSMTDLPICKDIVCMLFELFDATVGLLLNDREVTNSNIGNNLSACEGASRLSFCIGGPYGHGRKLRERANVSIKLSSLVLNHQIALLVLMEQLYRSWTILRGQKYHH
ncbi:hypothetical protein Lal_00044669 [Lupinus albus]|nr:hypothetical protein Lal_00044669 [Lupinus albus]